MSYQSQYSKPVEKKRSAYDYLCSHSWDRYLYAIGSDNYIKIGTTKNIKRRLAEIQTYVPFKVELMTIVHGSLYMEGQLHILLKPFQLHGEWFRLPEQFSMRCYVDCNEHVLSISVGALTKTFRTLTLDPVV